MIIHTNTLKLVSKFTNQKDKLTYTKNIYLTEEYIYATDYQKAIVYNFKDERGIDSYFDSLKNNTGYVITAENVIELTKNKKGCNKVITFDFEKGIAKRGDTEITLEKSSIYDIRDRLYNRILLDLKPNKYLSSDANSLSLYQKLLRTDTNHKTDLPKLVGTGINNLLFNNGDYWFTTVGLKEIKEQ